MIIHFKFVKLVKTYSGLSFTIIYFYSVIFGCKVYMISLTTQLIELIFKDDILISQPLNPVTNLSTQFTEMFNFPPRNQLNFPVLKSQSIGVWKSVSHFSLDLEIQVLITNSKRNIAPVVRFIVSISELYLKYLARTLQNLSGRCILNL